MPLDPSPSPAWIVGPVTWDLVGDARLPGGAASYAARVCEALDVQAHALVTAGEDASLDAFRGHEVCRLDAPTLTLRHDFATGERAQSLVQAAERTIRPEDAPEGWPEPVTLILGPLLPEDVDVGDFLDAYPGAEVALLAQGLQRAVLPDGGIAHRAQPASVLLDAARPNVTIFLAAEETALWPAAALTHLVARAGRVVVTEGERGAVLIDRSGSRRLPVAAAQPVDATGAGDVFAAAFILAWRAGEQYAGRLAAACAAVSVEVRGPAPLPSRAAIEARLPALPGGGASGGGQSTSDGGASA